MGFDDPSFWMAVDATNAANNANGRAREWKSYAQELEAQVEGLMKKLAAEQMHSAGLRASLDAMKATHPTSPVLSPVGERYQDGRPKSKLSKIYEEAYDKKGRELGITNPEAYRAN
ncbi:hypothetical protein [Azospirillum brasilense]|uniref:hypothetical protein n=1 Tax=Azospirillum brasilense TaxID=192 RepID=UPI000E695583|nr:hypothetical protein [Azospirillum brasilense]NUB24722.1 hypothetical protein [Azospirillum brasilense]NUB30674.1 hypothetical protein [Azospirillum brasilense]RIW08284.1 hypothetical protein D2T81_00805 [Azospirillum brasilense]